MISIPKSDTKQRAIRYRSESIIQFYAPQCNKFKFDKFHLYNGLVTARGWGRGEQTSALKLSFIFYILIFKQWNITSVHIKH